MASETCAVCGDSVPFDAAAHVLLNPPDEDVVDGYLCPSCYDEHFEGVLQHVEPPETGDSDDGENASDDEAVESGDEPAGDDEDGSDETADPVDADR